MVDFASNILKMITPGQPGGVAYAQKAFSEFDRNSDGAIAASEFLKVFATLEITKDRAPPGSSGIAPTYYLRPTLFDVTLFPSYGRNYAISLYQAQAMLGALDGDGDNSVSLAEMTAHAAGPTPPDPDDAVPPAEEIGPPQERAADLMAQYDLQKKGYIDVGDVVSVWLANPELGAIADAGNVIDAWDIDRDGAVTLEEVERGFTAMDAADAVLARFGDEQGFLSLNLAPEAVAELGVPAETLAGWDKNADALLSRRELIEGLRLQMAPPAGLDDMDAQTLAAALLARYDVDGSAAINQSEFASLIGDFGIAAEDAGAYFADWDDDGDGAITGEELRAGIDMIQKARKIVADYDVGGKGWFDVSDIQAAIDANPAEPDAPTAAEIMAWWDLDADGKVDVRELITGLYAGGSVKDGPETEATSDTA